jgi:uncharacterized protein YwqG
MNRLLIPLFKLLSDAYNGAYGQKRKLFMVLAYFIAFGLAVLALDLMAYHLGPKILPSILLVLNGIYILFLRKYLGVDKIENPFRNWLEKNKITPHKTEEVRAAVEKLAKPSIRFKKTESPTAAGGTKLGGLPDFPKDMQWPLYKDKPLSFLAQIRLSEVSPIPLAASLPPKGMLYFFYDQEQSVWGYDPLIKGYFAVLYHPTEDGLSRRMAPEGLEPQGQYKELALTAYEAPSYPDWSNPVFKALGKTLSHQCQIFIEKSMGGEPVHRLLGYPDVIQNEMEEECQLVTHGINCGSPEGYKDPRVESLKPGAKDWRLLFQVDSDDRTDMMWGDGGRLYFWVTEAMLKEKRFGDGWMILQCF